MLVVLVVVLASGTAAAQQSAKHGRQAIAVAEAAAAGNQTLPRQLVLQQTFES